MIQLIQLLLSLSFLVIIHELGHFTFARIFGVRVNKFYMFYNPRFSIVRLKKISGKWQVRFFAPNVLDNQKVALDNDGNPLLWENDKDPKVRKKYEKETPLTEEEWKAIERDYNFGKPLTKHTGHPKFTIIEDKDLPLLSDDDWRKYPASTEWGIGWVPLGGYCAIAGMVDETTTADQLGSTPQPWEYRAKSTWQRLPIICGGVLVNFVAALIFYSAILHHWGTDSLPLSNATYGLYFSEELLSEGFKQGDNIIAIGDRVPQTRADLLNWMVIDGEHDVTVVRNHADTIHLRLSDNFDQKVLAAGGASFIDYRFPFVINEVMPASPASIALLEKGDSIIAVGGVATECFQDVSAELKHYACDSVELTYVRNGEVMTASLYLGDEAKLGVYPKQPTEFLQTVHRDYGFWESIPEGCRYGWQTLVTYVKQFRLVFTPQGAKSLGGFAAIGSLFPSLWDWHSFWLMTAFLSIILAFMNIIPIPILDGGHVMFLLWEMITRKKPNEKFLDVANTIGFYLLLALLIFANGNDLIKWLSKFF
ncbi:MAG: RIP metalloprotease RseP [Paludibacteraceae bacterium]|nr:RIP metalloprotease RseP [Paludibacteraceae bacterium]